MEARDYKTIIENIYQRVITLEDKGKLPDYIPELAQIDPDKFGVHISSHQGFEFGIGDYQELFSLQSVSKVLALSCAYGLAGESIWQRVGVEPSGTAFNSLVQLEADKGIPRNPFINAGALVICDILVSLYKHPKEDFLDYCRKVSRNPSLKYNPKVAASEKSVGHRNIALCNFIKSFGNIHNDTHIVLDFYFHICSLEMSCQHLSNAFLFLVNGGLDPISHEKILSDSQTKRLGALMLTCGFYDEAGEFAFKVGLPGKSGVGGGIIAIQSWEYSIAVWSPRLNAKGNPYKGMKFLEEFTTATGSSIF
jgi:glutaminase